MTVTRLPRYAMDRTVAALKFPFKRSPTEKYGTLSLDDRSIPPGDRLDMIARIIQTNFPDTRPQERSMLESKKLLNTAEQSLTAHFNPSDSVIQDLQSEVARAFKAWKDEAPLM